MTKPTNTRKLYSRRLQDVKYFHRKLLVLHDPRGNWAILHPPRGPHLRRDWEKIERWMREVQTDADAGIAAATKWLAKTADLRREVEELRTKPLPPQHHSRPFPSACMLAHWASTTASLAKMYERHADHDRRMDEAKAAAESRIQARKAKEWERKLTQALVRLEGIQRNFERSRGVPEGHLTRHFDIHREQAHLDPYTYADAQWLKMDIPWD